MYKKQTASILTICALLFGSAVIASPRNPKKLKLGTYSATATQKTEYLSTTTNREVEIKIKIDSVDDGNVTGEFIHSTLGKGGKGGITGKIEDSNNLQLKGTLTSQFGDKWQVTLTVTIGDNQLTDGRYRLEARATTMTGHFKIAELEDDDDAQSKPETVSNNSTGGVTFNLPNDKTGSSDCLPKQGTLIIKMKDGSKKIIDLSEAETITVVP